MPIYNVSFDFEFPAQIHVEYEYTDGEIEVQDVYHRDESVWNLVQDNELLMDEIYGKCLFDYHDNHDYRTAYQEYSRRDDE